MIYIEASTITPGNQYTLDAVYSREEEFVYAERNEVKANKNMEIELLIVITSRKQSFIPKTDKLDFHNKFKINYTFLFADRILFYDLSFL